MWTCVNKLTIFTPDKKKIKRPNMYNVQVMKLEKEKISKIIIIIIIIIINSK